MSRLLAQPLGFAHRGGAATGPDNTLQAFATALAAGATGVETDARLSADGVPVLVHDDPLWSGGRRLQIGRTARSELPISIPALADLYHHCGTSYELAVDILDPDAVGPVLAVARAVGAANRLWLCHTDVATLARWRASCPEARLVFSTTRAVLRRSPSRLAARLRGAGVDAVNMRARWWTEELVALFHRHGRLTLGWQADSTTRLRRTLATGCDGVFCDDVAMMRSALTAAPLSPAKARRRSPSAAEEPPERPAQQDDDDDKARESSRRVDGRP